MIKTFCSSYIPLNSIADAQTLRQDFDLYNKMLREILPRRMGDALSSDQAKAAAVAAGIQKEPKKSGGGKRKSGEQSIHTTLKDKYKTTDYFVTSVEASASEIIKSAKEVYAFDIDTKEERIKSKEKQLDALNKKLNNLNKVKRSLIERSKARKAGRNIPKFKIQPISRVHDKKYVPLTFENDYLFELQYVDPMIRRLKTRINVIKASVHNLQNKVNAMKKKKERRVIPYHLVSRRKRKKWAGLTSEERIRLHRKHRQKDMLLAGRRDAGQGNYMVNYDPDTHTLYYRAAANSKKRIVVIPNVAFPYGQEFVDDAVSQPRGTHPVSWVIAISGNDIQIRCMIHMPDSPLVADDINNGVVGIDMNYDNISLSETDSRGNLVHSEIITFDPEGKSTGQYEQLLSHALKKVFERCNITKKPLAYENIQKLKKDASSKNKKRNRKVSMFAYDKMQELITSKANATGVKAVAVNPAYTSQIGKQKYMHPLHLSVHQAAAYTIARRGQNRKENLPTRLKARLPKGYSDKPLIKQWAAALKVKKAA